MPWTRRIFGVSLAVAMTGCAGFGLPEASSSHTVVSPAYLPSKPAVEVNWIRSQSPVDELDRPEVEIESSDVPTPL